MFKENYLNLSKFIWLVWMAILPLIASAQDDYPSFETLKARFPGEHVVMLEDKTIVDIRVLSGKTIIEKTIVEAYMILDQTGVAEHKKGVITFSSEEIKDIKAYTQDPSGRRYKIFEFETVDV